MIRRNFEHPIQVGMSFGLVSGVITSLGLVVGLAVGTQSRIAVIGGIVTIAIADSLSDALGIHISEEAENVHSSMEVWMATGATFMTKLVVSSSFLVPVLLLELEDAVWLSVAWGLASVAALSWYIARRQMTSRTVVLAEHVGVAVLVVIVSALVGRWVSMTFA
jgi:VIT1/CCC1 family predicted Fe2+/Mn2+ transporter